MAKTWEEIEQELQGPEVIPGLTEAVLEALGIADLGEPALDPLMDGMTEAEIEALRRSLAADQPPSSPSSATAA